MIDFELVIQDICNKGYHIIENFLDDFDFNALRMNVGSLTENGLMRKAKIGRQVSAQFHSAIRTDEIFWLDEDSTDQSIQAYLNNITLLAQHFNQSLFLNIVEFETHFAAYQPGTYYKKHVDQFASNKDRKISFVYYLNHHWQDAFGGELALYDKEDQVIQKVEPQANRFICFNSEIPHEVCVTHQPRYSIAGWMKSR